MDSLAIARTLRDAGFQQNQAETLAACMVEHDREHLATKSDIADVRTEIAKLRTETAELRTELKTDIQELRTETAERMGQQTRFLVSCLLAVTAVLGLLMTVLRFAGP